MNTLTTIQMSDVHTMTNGLMVYRAGSSFFAVYNHGDGIRSTIYLVTTSERKAHNAIRRVLQYAPNEMIAARREKFAAINMQLVKYEEAI